MLNYKTILTLLLIILSTNLLFSQRNCGSMEHLNQEILDNPNRLETLKKIEQHTANWTNNQNRSVVQVTIPVVVHVVYNNSTENISDTQIASQIQVLNDDFRRLNSDANNTWSQAADTEIDFCMATVDPNGNSTNGITRTSTNTTSFGTNDSVKFNNQGGKNAWPAADYMNIWICDIGGGILGYAQFPGGAASTDGVVVDYRYFGTTGTATAPFNLGRTGTHEVGHYLNLRHIWGDGNCNVDDFVTDTPNSDNPNYGCASGHSSCGTTDMVENYMDYSDDACMNLFTNGQKSRMQALFASGGARSSLANSNACGSSGGGATCSDGIQNQGETGVDCGGPCTACSSSCSQNDVTLTITFDNYPEETSWQIVNSSGSVIESGGNYGSQADGSTISLDFCISDGCFDFVINDTYGDGICCSYGNGSYSLTTGSTNLANGGNFTSSETTNFCLGGGPAPTCNDGIQNQGEAGIDCGGPCTACASCNDGVQNQGETGVDCGGPCSACPTCNDGVQNQGETGVDCGGPCAPCGGGGGSTVLFGHYFESGWDGWADGGSDCYRYSGTRSYEGTRSIRIRDNSGTASAMTSQSFNASNYSSIEVEFFFYAYSMENGEDFWVRFYDGSSWNTVATYARGTSFNNNTFYSATVTISNANYNLPSNAQLRFQCDASANADHIYIDAVTVTGVGNGSRTTGQSSQSIEFIEYINEPEFTNALETDLNVFPNPATDLVDVLSDDEIKNVQIIDINGKLVSTHGINQKQATLSIKDLNPGIYLIQIETEEELITEKLVKQ